MALIFLNIKIMLIKRWDNKKNVFIGRDLFIFTMKLKKIKKLNIRLAWKMRFFFFFFFIICIIYKINFFRKIKYSLLIFHFSNGKIELESEIALECNFYHYNIYEILKKNQIFY